MNTPDNLRPNGRSPTPDSTARWPVTDPDSGDVLVYLEQPDPDDPTAYMYDGTSRPMTKKTLEVAVLAPERVRGLLLEMPVLDNALEAGIMAFGPLLFAARFLPLTITTLRWVTKPIPRGIVPFWDGKLPSGSCDRPTPCGR